MSGAPANVFTIPSGAPFLHVLADTFLSGRLVPIDRGDPLALADAAILLPTRRAARALREILIERLGGDAAILPRIRPIGDIDEEDHLLAPSAESTAERLILPPAISPLARQLALTRLTLAWGVAVRREILSLSPDEPLLIPASAADATRLATDLARLIDDLAIAGVSWDAVTGLAPEEHAGYFRITLDFLKIAAERWPQFLVENNLVDPATRRDQLIRAEAERLRAAPPGGPIVAAGSTGSIPATAELLAAIAHAPNGAVVLQGLDQSLDERAWNAIGGKEEAAGAAWGHPQFALKQLLALWLKIDRRDVVPLGRPARAVRVRARLAAEALRPADTTEAWAAFHPAATPRAVSAALAGVSLLVARNEQEEALAVAVAVRAALEEGAATVAVVTPDRGLARRISVELGRWDLSIDDSAGSPLGLLPPGIFARLLVEAVSGDGDPVKLLALLKHPLAAFGMSRPNCRCAARMLEIALFRGRRVPGGLSALAPALAAARAEITDGNSHVPMARRRLHDGDWATASRLVEAIVDALGPLEAMVRAGGRVSASAATALLTEALAGAARDETGTADRLWQGAGGEALAVLLDGLAAGGGDLSFSPDEFPAFLDTLMSEVAVTRPAGADPRIHIWGALEARLQSVDLLVLAGLDEGVWPSATRTDPWLSRAMRAEIGLPPPERRIGQAAHDFAEGLAAPRVIVSRAGKRDGAPTVASRWLQRLAALLGEEALKPALARGQRYLELARHLDSVDIPRPVRRPRPSPPVEARPKGLSITEIETLVRDPYAIYARHVLRLEELDPPGRAPDYALRGSLLHQAIGDFTIAWKGAYDAAAETRLRETGATVLAAIADFPDVHALWSARFAAIARWLMEWERGRSGEVAARHAEISGALEIPVADGTFRLRGRADRIDVRRDGNLDILDYKTGTPPSAKEVLQGFAPQLALEAAMARRGAFGEEFRDRSVETLAWIGLSKVEWGEPLKSAVEKDWTADLIAERVMEQFTALIGWYAQPATQYLSRARPKFQQRYDSPYDHLARFHEWALVEGEEDFLWPGPPKP